MDYKALSKTIAYVLRHAPWLYELELDATGWVDVGALLAGLRAERPEWAALEVADLEEMLRCSAKARYQLETGRIRALYGHSLPDKVRKAVAEPPALLYHGTDPALLDTLRQQGLRPMGRQYVHLSAATAMARQVGQRKCRRPVILHVQAGAAFQAGLAFYPGNDQVWLADRVAPEFIVFPGGSG